MAVLGDGDELIVPLWVEFLLDPKDQTIVNFGAYVTFESGPFDRTTSTLVAEGEVEEWELEPIDRVVFAWDRTAVKSLPGNLAEAVDETRKQVVAAAKNARPAFEAFGFEL